MPFANLDVEGLSTLNRVYVHQDTAPRLPFAR